MDRNLAAFIAVARTENLTKASEELGLTQPSITKRIANLEVELGTPLFDRHRRGMALTPAGQLFLDRAQRIKQEYEQAREEIGAIASAGLSVLRVGAGPLFHLRYVAPLFSLLKRKHPSLTLELIADANVRTIPMLLAHELDAVLGVIEPGAVDGTIIVKPVTWVEHGIVLPADDPRAATPRIDPSILADKKWALYTEDSAAEQTIRDYYLPQGIAPPLIDVRTSSFSTGLQLVVRGEFVMSAPLQLAPVIEREGLVIRPALRGMPRRQAGIHVRKSSLSFGAVHSLMDAFDELGLMDVD